MTVCDDALVENAFETVKLVLLMILLTVRISLLTAICVPIVRIPSVFATLNRVFVPVTVIDPFVISTRPDTDRSLTVFVVSRASIVLMIGNSA